ncbi:MAG: SDR family NAD(P)-dependent oxidoreductase [Dehalococcoidia bacterium]|nr:SDR family NAD(P)-dependent oxidoreductase [Dehalococcoidia bacterium]
MINYDITGKVAVVTGGSHGIGLAVAHKLDNQGCKVVICARDRAKLNAFCDNRPCSMGIVFDAQEPGTIPEVIAEVVAEYGGVDILVNNVGGGGRWGAELVEETKLNVWEEVYTKNAVAATLFTRYVIPYMRRKHWGRVVTVASLYGKEGGGRPWFTMAKAAEIALMKSLALMPYLVRDGLTFNTVAPGHIAIPGTGSDAEMDKGNELPLGRMGTPEEVASVVVFLCSKQASLVNGACISVDGGESRSY